MAARKTVREIIIFHWYIISMVAVLYFSPEVVALTAHVGQAIAPKASECTKCLFAQILGNEINRELFSSEMRLTGSYFHRK